MLYYFVILVTENKNKSCALPLLLDNLGKSYNVFMKGIGVENGPASKLMFHLCTYLASWHPVTA